MIILTNESGKIISFMHDTTESNIPGIHTGIKALPGQSMYRLYEVPEHILSDTKIVDEPDEFVKVLESHFTLAETKAKMKKINSSFDK